MTDRVTNDDMWRAIGLSNRLKNVHEKMWHALVEERKHITIYADREPLMEVDWDYTKDCYNRED